MFSAIVDALTEKGYAPDDIAWAENTKPPRNSYEFAREAIFVICNSGMKHTIAQQIFRKCMDALLSEASASTVFGHAGKAAAIDSIWANQKALLADYLAAPDKIEFCKSLPWIGGITCFHLAKNFGAQVAKPDVHLKRLADRHACTAQDLCERLAEKTGYCVNTVDLLLWRACAVGILDPKTAKLKVSRPTPAPVPEAYQQPLFEPYQPSFLS